MNSPHLNTEELSAFIDAELGAHESARVEAHLQGCATCRQELSDLERTVLAVRALPPVSLPRSFRVAAAPARPVGWSLLGWLNPPLLRAAGGLAAALMVAIVAVDALSPARILEAPLSAPLAGLQGAEAQVGQERVREASQPESRPGAALRAEPAADARQPAATPGPQTGVEALAPDPPAGAALGERAADASPPGPAPAPPAGIALAPSPQEPAAEAPPSHPLRAAEAAERTIGRWATPGRLAAVVLGVLAAALLAGSFLLPRRR